MRIILGVGGGIAAYKVATLLRLFTEAGHDVTVVPTASSLKFVGAATWEALSGNPVSNSVFDQVERVNHVRLGQEADLVIVAPATADLLAKAAAGLADDLLTGTLLMASGRVFMAPAMHTEMWEHPATVENVARLRARGVLVMDPAFGRLTGSDSGAGRLPDPEEIHAAALAFAHGLEPAPGPAGTVSAPPTASGALSGKTVTITAGGTREPLDPVRFLGNRSSGRQGVALARQALRAGAAVRLIAANLEIPAPPGIDVVRVETALELREATLLASKDSHAVIMAAAVADFRPADVSSAKIKKTDDDDAPVIRLVRNPDILRELVELRALGGAGKALATIVGFAAETGDVELDALSHARRKLARKGCDLLVLNIVGKDQVFGKDTTSVTILEAAGGEPTDVQGSKDEVAEVIIQRIAALAAL